MSEQTTVTTLLKALDELAGERTTPEPRSEKLSAYLIACEELGRAKDYERAIRMTPGVPRRALKKAILETHAARMRAKRLLETAPRSLPAVLRAQVQAKLKQ